MDFKKIPSDYFVTILDRLSRFEPAYIKYERVFNDIINKFSISKKLKDISLNEKIALVEEIFNSSLKTYDNDFWLNDLLIEIEKKSFLNNELSYQYLSNRLNISRMVLEAEISKNAPKNVIWLKNIVENRKNIFELRKEKKLLYPIEKIILCEGQTEYVLLETLFKLFNISFNELGILVMPAGGKNQVARKYYNMIEYTKTPFFILLDKDALPIKNLIEPKLRKIDKIYIIKSGEFEDLIPKKVLKNAINKIHENELNCTFEDFDDNLSMVCNLENIYKKYGFGEFKKAHFAICLKKFLEQNFDKNDFENSEIIEIVRVFNQYNQKPDRALERASQ